MVNVRRLRPVRHLAGLTTPQHTSSQTHGLAPGNIPGALLYPG